MGLMASRTRTLLFFGLSFGLGLVVACGINSQPVPPGFDDNGAENGDASNSTPTTGNDAGSGTGSFNDADAADDGGDASDLDAGDAGDGSDDGGDAGDGG